MKGVKSNSRLLIDLFHDIPSIFVLSLDLTDVSFDSSCTSSYSNTLVLEFHLYNANPASAMICVTSTLSFCKLSMLSHYLGCHLTDLLLATTPEMRIKKSFPGC